MAAGLVLLALGIWLGVQGANGNAGRLVTGKIKPQSDVLGALFGGAGPGPAAPPAAAPPTLPQAAPGGHPS